MTYIWLRLVFKLHCNCSSSTRTVARGHTNVIKSARRSNFTSKSSPDFLQKEPRYIIFKEVCNHRLIIKSRMQPPTGTAKWLLILSVWLDHGGIPEKQIAQKKPPSPQTESKHLKEHTPQLLLNETHKHAFWFKTTIIFLAWRYNNACNHVSTWHTCSSCLHGLQIKDSGGPTDRTLTWMRSYSPYSHVCARGGWRLPSGMRNFWPSEKNEWRCTLQG